MSSSQRLSDLTIEELKYRLECLQDTLSTLDAEDAETSAELAPLVISIIRTLELPTIGVLSCEPGAKSELLFCFEAALGDGTDLDAAASARTLYFDLIRAGAIAKADRTPDRLLSGRKPKIMRIDGIEYENWYPIRMPR